MKAWLKIVIKLGISIILFAILYLMLGYSVICRSTVEGSAGLPGCFASATTILQLALYFLISVLIVWLADWIIGKLRK